MSDGIATISKGLLQQAIERVANNAQQRPAFLAILKGGAGIPGTDWLDFLRDSGGLDRAAVRYVRDQWFQFWPSISQAETIMCQSLIEAIELANSLTTDEHNPMPIDCHWIWTDDQKKFEVLITYNARQVTRILLTPRPPTERTISLIGLAPYFVVKPRDYIDPAQEQALPRDPRPPGGAVPAEEQAMQAFLRMPRDPGEQWVTAQLRAPE